MRVLAVTPTYEDRMRPEMRASVEALDLDGLELTWMVIDEQPYPAPDHRNVLHMYRKARKRALAGRYDVMWTIEHDMVLPRDAAQHLNATPGDVVYGVYLIRFGTEVLNVFRYLDDAQMGESLSLDREALDDALAHTVVRVSGTGWGCTWIRREALKRITFPERYADNPPFDIGFSHLCLRHGLRMYANLRVQCGHIKGEETLWPAEFHREVEYGDHTWLIDGQQIRAYRLKAGAAPDPGAAWVGLSGPGTVHVRALQNVVAKIGAESRRLRMGQEYDVPAADAVHLIRGGYAAEVAGVS